jgi:hypothetical protein
MTRQAATNDDLARDLWWCDRSDAEFHSAIGKQESLSWPHFMRKWRIVDGDTVLIASDVGSRERKAISRMELHGFFRERAEANFWSRQILQDGDWLP